MPLLILLAACTVPPEAPPVAAGALTGPWPRIVPLEAATVAGDEGTAAEDALRARAAMLRARAAALGGPVIEPGARARLDGPAPG